MNITALTSTGRQTRAIQRPRPLLSVMTWEFRRFRASRLFWFQALGLFGFLLLMTWALHAPENFSGGVASKGGNGVSLSGFVAGTSAGGLLHTLPTVLIVLVLLLPFVTADGVTRDVNRRTHELLMTTALPTWAYVWGRYLAGLVMSLGLALLLLASILGMVRTTPAAGRAQPCAGAGRGSRFQALTRCAQLRCLCMAEMTMKRKREQ